MRFSLSHVPPGQILPAVGGAALHDFVSLAQLELAR